MEETPIKRIAQGTLILLLGVIFSKFLGYAYRIIIARNGIEEYGVFSLALAVYSLALAVASLGIPDGLTRYLSYYRGKEQPDKMKAIFKLSIRLMFFSGLVTFGILFLAAPFISNTFFNMPSLTLVLQIIIIAIPFDLMARIYVNTLRSLELPKYEAIVRNIIENVAKIGITVIFFLIGIKLLGITIGFAIAIILSFVILSFIIIKKFSPFKYSNKYFGMRKELLKYSIPLFMSGFVIFIYTSIDTVMIGRFKDAVAVGIYNAAVPTAQLLYIFPAALMAMFLPIITMVYAKEDENQFRKVYQTATRWILMVNLALVIPIFIFSKEILSILFGSVYVAASVPLMILLVGRFFDFSFFASHNVLLVVKRTKLFLMNTALTAVLNLVLNYFLIPIYGVNGAALATAISISFLSLLVLIETKVIIKYLPFKSTALKILASGLFSGIILYYIKMQWSSDNLFVIIIQGILFLGLYLFLLFVTKAIEDEDIGVLLMIEDKMGRELKLVKKILRKFR